MKRGEMWSSRQIVLCRSVALPFSPKHLPLGKGSTVKQQSEQRAAFSIMYLLQFINLGVTYWGSKFSIVLSYFIWMLFQVGICVFIKKRTHRKWLTISDFHIRRSAFKWNKIVLRGGKKKIIISLNCVMLFHTRFIIIFLYKTLQKR